MGVAVDGALADLATTADLGAGDDTGASDAASTGCQAWEITYDLTDSVFEVYGTPMNAGNQVNTVATPYTDDNHVGPGTLVLRFQDLGGTPGGLAAIVSYDMVINFTVKSLVTSVLTDLTSKAGPEACGVTTGTLSGTTVAWSPSALAGATTVGSITCTGSMCSLGGFQDGVPKAVNETGDQPLSDFVFSSDLKSFTMAKTVIQQDTDSTTAWTYKGAETKRQLISVPTCYCP
jgi:hypothetical protein